MSASGMVVALLFFGAGLAGTAIPMLPGAPLIWIGMFLYGFFVDFRDLSWQFYLWQGALVGLSFLVGYIATSLGTRFSGGSKAAIRGGVVGLILGPILMGPAGIFLGPFLGAVAAEILAGRRLEEGIKAGVGALVGQLGGTVLNLLIAMGMITWFFWIILAR